MKPICLHTSQKHGSLHLRTQPRNHRTQLFFSSRTSWRQDRPGTVPTTPHSSLGHKEKKARVVCTDYKISAAQQEEEEEEEEEEDEEGEDDDDEKEEEDED